MPIPTHLLSGEWGLSVKRKRYISLLATHTSLASSVASVGKARGGGLAGSNQPTATASSPAVGTAAGSAMVAANHTPRLGRFGSWKFEATCSTSPRSTRTPA